MRKVAMCRKILFLLVMLFSFPASADRGAVLRSFLLPARPTGLAWDGKVLWVSSHQSNVIVGIDLATQAVVCKVPAPSNRISGLTFDGKHLWALDTKRRLALRVDPQTGYCDHRVELESQRPRGLAWYKGHLFVGDDWKDQIHEVDPEDGTSMRIFQAPSTGISGLAMHNGYLYVADRQDDAIYAVEPESGRALFWFPSPGPHPTGMVQAGEDLFVADYETTSAYVVDMTPGKKPYRTFDERPVAMEFTWSIRNGGPGKVLNAQVIIAVPRSQPYQEILGPPVFDPLPTRKAAEESGQELAFFDFGEIGPGENAVAKMRVEATLSRIRYLILPSDVGTLKEVPQDVVRTYTGDGSKLWLSHPLIRETARQLAEKSEGLYTLVRNTYEFVIDRMEYDLAGGWNTAPLVLERGTGSCSEYSMLLMALLRANGVPVRFAGSLVVRGDNASWDDVFHRWVEVYLPRIGWVPMDANKGDQDRPSQRAAGFGELENRYLVTTLTPGHTGALGWTYVYRSQWSCEGECSVEEDAVAEWSPLAR